MKTGVFITTKCTSVRSSPQLGANSQFKENGKQTPLEVLILLWSIETRKIKRDI
jgi:hypothetical protein